MKVRIPREISTSPECTPHAELASIEARLPWLIAGAILTQTIQTVCNPFPDRLPAPI